MKSYTMKFETTPTRLHNYTLKYLSIGLFFVLTLWVVLFYAFMLDEVYDNIDDGLKNSKLEIIKKAYSDPAIRSIQEFDINGFRITALPKGEYSTKNKFDTQRVYMEFDDSEEPIRVLTTHFKDANGNDYKLEIRTSTIEQDDLLADFGLAILALYFMLLFSIFLINYFVLKRVWAAFYFMLKRLKDYRVGGNTWQTPKQSPVAEFADLNSEIQQMIQRTEVNFEQQKVFVSNAAHEMQTPLAIATSKLELLAEQNNLDVQQMQEIETIHATLGRLIKINKSLLMLTRIENQQFVDYKWIDFNEIVSQSLQELEDLIQFKHISVTLEQSVNKFCVYMDKGLALILWNNLLKNAIVHNREQGSIVIILTASSLSICNDSGDDSALDPLLIFQRFFSGTGTIKGSGLGLSLVETIVNKVSGLHIKYSYEQKHKFELYLKD